MAGRGKNPNILVAKEILFSSKLSAPTAKDHADSFTVINDPRKEDFDSFNAPTNNKTMLDLRQDIFDNQKAMIELLLEDPDVWIESDALKQKILDDKNIKTSEGSLPISVEFLLERETLESKGSKVRLNRK